MKNLILTVLIVGGLGYFGAKFYLHYRVSSGLDDALLMASPFVDIQYDGVSSTMSGELSIDGVTARMNQFSDPLYIDRLSIITPGFFYLLNLDKMGQDGEEFEMPETFGFAIEGMRASTSADYMHQIHKMSQDQVVAEDAGLAAAVCTGKYGYSPETLKRLGYDEIVMSMRMTYRQDANDLFVDVTADVEDMYAIDMTVELADPLTPEMLTRGNYRPRMVEGRLEYLDQSLDERTTKLCTREGLSEAEVIMAKLDAFSHSGLENGIQFDEYVMEPYREFLDGRSTFVLTSKPSEPINLSQISLYSPSDVPALLNLSGEVL